MSTFSEKALAAWKVHKAENAEYDAEGKIQLGLHTRAALTKLGVRADLVDGNLALVDGVRLHRSTDGDWQVAGTCPDCGAAGWAPPRDALGGGGPEPGEFLA